MMIQILQDEKGHRRSLDAFMREHEAEGMA
jgi:hypothetical protein